MADDWKLKPHTAAKHELLRRYLGAWYPILAQSGYNRRIVYIDGFAGPGIYSGGEPGSPIIAMNTLVTHPAFPRLSHTEFVFVFVEKRKAYFDSLTDEVEAFWDNSGGRPKNVKLVGMNDTFVSAANEILAMLDEDKRTLAPTFGFIDPFGWSGVPIDLICRLLSYDKCEIFFNFMFNEVNRFVTDERPEIACHFEDLFGTDGHQDAAGLDPEDRKQFLHDLYAEQLRTKGKFKYVRSFEMINEKGRTHNYLFYGTRNITGLRVMKEAMWAVDPAGGLRFSDRTAGEVTLFGDEPDYDLLQRQLMKKFRGKDVSVEDVEKFVIVDTSFGPRHYKKGALKVLEQDERIEIVTPRKKRLTYPDGTVIRFNS
jgi:three-Cys-motif partner protein